MRKVNSVSVEVEVGVVSEGVLAGSMNEGHGRSVVTVDLVDLQPDMDMGYLVELFKEAYAKAVQNFKDAKTLDALANGEIVSSKRI